tara:strand:+ start:2238 stop:3008 length:771 start_codon:yes stop_codon:yes gene_type:complete
LILNGVINWELILAGHSKWANIRFRKGAQDAKRGKLFTKLIREITVAAKESGGDPSSNPRLRTAIDKAKSQSMPKDKIEKAVKRGTGEETGVNYEEVRYEGYGPGGVAILVDCLTDNRNRTVAEVRHALTKYNGNLGADGSVSYLFTHTGIISYSNSLDEEKLMELAIEAGANDIISNDDSIDILTAPSDMNPVKDFMSKSGFDTELAEVTMRAENKIKLDNSDAESLLKLIDALDELDDVQDVYSNAEIDELFEG